MSCKPKPSIWPPSTPCPPNAGRLLCKPCCPKAGRSSRCSLSGRDLVAEQRYLIWRECEGRSEAWREEQRRIQDDANRKRSEAAKEQTAAQVRTSGGTFAPGAPTECGQTRPSGSTNTGSKAKAKASQTNRGAVERGDLLAKERPDLAEKVRLGEMKPSEAHRQMKRDAVACWPGRNLTPDQFTLLLGRRYNRTKGARGGDRGNQYTPKDQIDPLANTADKLAEQYGVSAPTVKRAGQCAEAAEWATEIRVRAERRAGEMLAAQREAGMMNTGARGQLVGPGVIGGHAEVPPIDNAPTLAEIGISKNQSSRWQKLAAIPETQFEQAVEAAKEIAGGGSGSLTGS